jgi:hypothetical protein
MRQIECPYFCAGGTYSLGGERGLVLVNEAQKAELRIRKIS